MPNLNTTTAVNATDVAGGLKDTFFSKVLLKMIMQDKFSHRKYAIKKTMPMNHGDTINFRRFAALAPVTSPLSEGVPPDGKLASGSSLTATLLQYGDAMFISDRVENEQMDDIKGEYTIAFGNQAQKSLDEICRDIMYTGASKWFAKGTTIDGLADDADSRPKLDLFRKIALSMKRNLIQPEKTENRYVALVGSEVMYDLLDDEKLEKKYMLTGNTNGPVRDNVIIDIYDLHFVETLNPKIVKNVGNINVHVSFVIGDEAYAEIKLGDQDVQVFTKAKGSAGTLDPIDQVSSIGWKINGYTVKVLNAVALHALHTVPTNN